MQFVTIQTPNQSSVAAPTSSDAQNDANITALVGGAFTPIGGGSSTVNTNATPPMDFYSLIDTLGGSNATNTGVTPSTSSKITNPPQNSSIYDNMKVV